MRYWFSLREDGRPNLGRVLSDDDPPSGDRPVEGTEEVWLNQTRSFYGDGRWVTYPPITLSAPATASVGEAIEAVAALPPNSPDSELFFRFLDTNIPEELVENRAAHLYQFMTPGTYKIGVMSQHHGVTALEVLVQ